MDKFRSDIYTFSQDIENCKNIVQRFDEVLSLKASKIGMRTLEDEMKKTIKSDEYIVKFICLSFRMTKVESTIKILSLRLKLKM